MRLVLDTNILVSAFLWEGTPGRLIKLAGDGKITLYASRALIDEFTTVISRKKFARQAAATGLTTAEMLRNYRRLATPVVPAEVQAPHLRDPKDLPVLACAVAARADMIVSGDRKHLLVMREFEGIPIVSTAEALRRIDSMTRR